MDFEEFIGKALEEMSERNKRVMKNFFKSKPSNQRKDVKSPIMRSCLKNLGC